MFARFANMDALKEIARVLQPTGVLAMVWNVEDCESDISTLDKRYTDGPRQCTEVMGDALDLGSGDERCHMVVR